MAKDFYSAREAAKALGISLDTLRRWDREGRIATARDAGNRRIVPRGGDRASARRRRRAHAQRAQPLHAAPSRDVKVEGLLAQVELVVTEPVRVVAVVTRDAVEELGLEAGRSGDRLRQVDVGDGRAR